MHLKRLEIVGFKSFADKTVFHLDTGVTCFVGPNGSGKSNIVDAIRWALGEQSAKRLRGGEMQDVIFAGSTTRKPSTFAEVTLIFDNTDRMLAVDYVEVSVTRRLLNTGESFYMINRQECRLKDVKELFLGTGIGGGSYNVIEQGKVDALLQAGPLERRKVIEEVAGISGYKMRRDFAKSKLERLDLSLETVKSIEAEVDKRLRSLSRQVGKARKYREVREQLTTLELDVSARRLAVMDDEFHSVTAGIESLQSQLAKMNASVAEIEALEMDEARARTEIAERLQAAETTYRDTVVAAERAKAAAQAADETVATEKERIIRLRAELTNLTRRVEESKLALATLVERKTALAAKVDNERALLQSGTAKAEDLVSRLRVMERDIDDMRKKAYETAAERSRMMNRSQDLANRAVSLKKKLDREQERIFHIESEISQHTFAATRNKTLSDEAARCEAALSRLHSVLERRISLAERRDGARERRANRLSRSATALGTRLKLLQKMHAHREGFSEDARSFADRLTTRGVTASLLGEMLSVPATYRKAVEAALDGLLGTVIIKEFAPPIIEGMTERRVDLYPGGARGESFPPVVPAAEDRGVCPALSIITCPDEVKALVEDLLGTVLIIEGDVDVNDIRARHPESTLVTLNGEMLRPCGMLSIRKGEALPGVLGRVDEIAEVSDAFSRTEARRVHHSFRRSAERISAAAEKRDAAKAQADSYSTAAAAALTQAEKLRSERDLITSENQHVVTEAAQLEAAALKEADAASNLVAVETETSALLAKRLAELDAQRKIADAVRNETAKQATALARLEEQLKSLDAETASGEKALTANTSAVQRATAEISRSEIAVQEASAAGESSRAQVATLVTSADVIRQETVRLANDRSRLDAAREERAARRKTIDKDISALRDEMEKFRVRENALTLTRASLIQDVLERYSRDLGELTAQLAKPVTPPTQEEEDRLAQLKRQMANLGPVNLAAIEEEDELRERATFLKTEIKDLETARTRLFEAIDKLDTFCRDKFTDSLNKVGTNFQEIFRKLFQGGDVKLRLLEGDILEAGLEVTVHPPGKEPRVLSLLSGGEKAMTAIAMIMAAFKASPSPFCLLDEVDGPLDEANVERLNLLIQEFAANTQFAVITHNKLTMTYADIIYGIAMEEPGVSKYIKTDLVKAAENLAVAD